MRSILGVALVASAMVVGCGSSSTRTDGGATDGGISIAVDAAGGGTDAHVAVDAASSTSCADEASFNDCAQCFAEENTAGYQAYANFAVTDVYCGETCGTTCEATCSSGSTPTDECGACASALGSSSAEIQQFLADCQADSDCLAFLTSLEECPSS